VILDHRHDRRGGGVEGQGAQLRNGRPGSGLEHADPWVTSPDLLTQCKLVVVGLILMVVAPTATHAITKAAHLHSLRPWTKSDPGGEP
jgi:hypothetical protein